MKAPVVLSLMILAVLVHSCGLETVTSLSPPLGLTNYLSQTNYQTLTATFSKGNYSNIDGFQGYEVYYKVYPLSTTGPFTNLAADVTRLNSSPTYSYLQTLGYQRMNGSNTQPTTVPLINLQSAADQTTITLDFTSFLSQLNAANGRQSLGSDNPSVPSPLPILTLPSGASSFSGTVYRTESNTTFTGSTVHYPYFNELYRSWANASGVVQGSSDLDSTVTSATSQYEIDVFLIAYAFTLEATTYSQPVAWGVIYPLDVPR